MDKKIYASPELVAVTLDSADLITMSDWLLPEIEVQPANNTDGGNPSLESNF